MSYCCICAKKKTLKVFKYDPVKYHGLALLRMYDRKSVCACCHNLVEAGDLLVVHSQLPLASQKYGYHKGVFVTKKYLSYERIAEYTGKRMMSKTEVEKSDSIYIIRAFSENSKKSTRVWIDGNCTSKSTFFYIQNY